MSSPPGKRPMKENWEGQDSIAIENERKGNGVIYFLKCDQVYRLTGYKLKEDITVELQ
jgi:hypothetical protein